MQVILTAAAAGVVLFLLWDILSNAVEPLADGPRDAQAGTGPVGDAVADAVALAASLAVGLLSIVWVTRRMRGARSEMDLRQIALGTAVGLGLHNFSEGLAIGQSAATGATSLALLLVIGFALHNATEGFGIAAPLSSGRSPAGGSWRSPASSAAVRPSSAAWSATRSSRPSSASSSWGWRPGP